MNIRDLTYSFNYTIFVASWLINYKITCVLRYFIDASSSLNIFFGGKDEYLLSSTNSIRDLIYQFNYQFPLSYIKSRPNCLLFTR